jgi:hypothetical protein
MKKDEYKDDVQEIDGKDVFVMLSILILGFFVLWGIISGWIDIPLIMAY